MDDNATHAIDLRTRTPDFWWVTLTEQKWVSFRERRGGQISRSEYAHIPELDFVYLYARQLQYGNEPDPEFPNGEPDISELRAWMEYRNRREARALEEGRYKPLPFDAEWGLTQGHSFGLMSARRLEEIVSGKELKAKEYAPCDAYWLLVVVEFIDPAQEQEIRVDGLTMTSDVFERIIVYKPRFEHIVEMIPHGNGGQSVATT